MKRVQYFEGDTLRGEGILIPPKRITDLNAWFRAARRVIPDIPPNMAGCETSLKHIVYHIRKEKGPQEQDQYVVIHR